MDLAGDFLCVATSVHRSFCCCLCVFHFPLLFILSRFFCHFDSCVVVFSFHFPFVVLVSSGSRNSIISSSHLFFGLPTGLFVWYLVLRPGFHFTAFLVHRSFGGDAILSAKHNFILSVRFNPALDFFCSFHPFRGFSSCASFHVFNPVFFFTFRRVNFFISIVHEGDFAVLIAICV